MVFYNLLIIRIVVMSYHPVSPRSASWRDGDGGKVVLSERAWRDNVKHGVHPSQREVMSEGPLEVGRPLANLTGRPHYTRLRERARLGGSASETERRASCLFTEHVLHLWESVSSVSAQEVEHSAEVRNVTLNLIWFRAILSFGAFVMFWHTRTIIPYASLHRFTGVSAKSAKKYHNPQSHLGRLNTSVANVNPLHVFLLLQHKMIWSTFDQIPFSWTKSAKIQYLRVPRVILPDFSVVWGVFCAILHSSLCWEDD